MTNLTPTQAIAHRRRAEVAVKRCREAGHDDTEACQALAEAERAEADCMAECERRREEEAKAHQAAEAKRLVAKRRALRMEDR